MRSFRSLKNLFLLVVGLGLCYALYALTESSLEEIGEVILNVSLYYLALFIAVDFIFLLFRAIRWQFISEIFYPGMESPKSFYLSHMLMSLAAYMVSASGSGTVLRIAAQKIHCSVSLIGASSILAVEHMANIFLVLLMTIVMFLYLHQLVGVEVSMLIAMALTLGAISILVIYHKALLSKGLALLGGILKLFKKDFSDNFRMINERVGEVGNDKVAMLFVYSVVIYAIPPIYYFVLARALHIEVSFLELLIVFPIIYLASVLSFTPFGIGVREVGNAGAMLALGVPNEQALAFAALTRIFGDVTNIGLAISGYLMWLYHNRPQLQRNSV